MQRLCQENFAHPGSEEQTLRTRDLLVCERNGLTLRASDTLEDMGIDDKWRVCATTSM